MTFLITSERFSRASEYLEQRLAGHPRVWLVEPGFAPSDRALEALNVVVNSWSTVELYSGRESGITVYSAPVGPMLAPRWVVTVSWRTPPYALATAFHSRHCALVLGAEARLPQDRLTAIVEEGVTLFRSTFAALMSQALAEGPPTLSEQLLAHSTLLKQYGRTVVSQETTRSAVQVVVDPITERYWVALPDSPCLGGQPAVYDSFADPAVALVTAENFSLYDCDELAARFKWQAAASRTAASRAPSLVTTLDYGPVVPAGYRVKKKGDSWDWYKSGDIPVQVPAEVYEALAYAIRKNRTPRHADDQEER